MFLNDALDRKIDLVERPERPIPSNEVTARAVFSVSGLMLSGGLFILTGIGYLMPTGTGFWSVMAGLILCSLIILYDWHHKNNPLSPLIMGACRMMVYVTAGFAVSSHPSAEVLWGGMVLLSWIIGLTYISKQETLEHIANLWPLGFLALPFLYCFPYALEGGIGAIVWVGLLVLTVLALYLVKRRKPGDIGLAVLILIAGISLIDALFIVEFGDQSSALLAIAAFAFTLVLQRFVPGT
jgi:4-hydroxybenzoate polyprenyltransferase